MTTVAGGLKFTTAIEAETDQAWRVYRSMQLLERNPVFHQIASASSSTPERARARKAVTRGYPRDAFAA